MITWRACFVIADQVSRAEFPHVTNVNVHIRHSRGISVAFTDVDVFWIFAYDLSLIARLEWHGGTAG